MTHRYTLADIKAAAQYRWQEIHAAIGIPPEALRNRHQPCPCCGGKDRFRYDDKDGNGTFICSHYHNGAGNGFDLIMHFLGCDFQTALKQTASILGMDKANPLPIPPKPKPTQPRSEKDRLARLQKIWDNALPLEPNSPAVQYLKSRGLAMNGDLPQTIRYAPELNYWTSDPQGKPLLLGKFPCMIAAITDRAGNLQGLHQTYLQPRYHTSNRPQWTKASLIYHGNALPSKKMQSRQAGSLNGNAVQLFPMPENGMLIAAEGIETALAAKELLADGKPCGLYATLSANGMKSLVLPDSVKELLIIADNDISQTGQEAANALYIRAKRAGIAVKCWISSTAGYDCLDELNSLKNSVSNMSENSDGIQATVKQMPSET